MNFGEHADHPSRTVDRIALRQQALRTKPPECSSPGCSKAGREGKPFCPDHFDQLPYARRLMDRVERQGRELERLERWLVTRPMVSRAANAPPFPLVMEEVRQGLACRTLTAGATTLEGLRKALGPLPNKHLTREALSFVLSTLRKLGQARRAGESTRGVALWAATAQGSVSR